MVIFSLEVKIIYYFAWLYFQSVPCRYQFMATACTTLDTGREKHTQSYMHAYGCKPIGILSQPCHAHAYTSYITVSNTVAYMTSCN